ncbi:hypothetical protein J2X20_002916 [Pelomonas saccharophila]|jgi:hypothetical protein|uniref:Uncharacterized protein n=1 Tax=Roseateles saccharophilus TaxID=304 RepID=A0ABU1YN25_ROSSA|nr:hypothetical protein [Roseateles saccharophilus]
MGIWLWLLLVAAIAALLWAGFQLFIVLLTRD